MQESKNYPVYLLYTIYIITINLVSWQLILITANSLMY